MDDDQAKMLEDAAQWIELKESQGFHVELSCFGVGVGGPLTNDREAIPSGVQTILEWKRDYGLAWREMSGLPPVEPPPYS